MAAGGRSASSLAWSVGEPKAKASGAASHRAERLTGDKDIRESSGHGTTLALSRTFRARVNPSRTARSEEHTSELQSLMRISYAVFCLKKKTQTSLESYP